jgi:cyanophycin synthetase
MMDTMNKFSEPVSKKSSCVYCGDAPINHKLFYFSSMLSVVMDNHILRVTKHAPLFMRDFIDFLLKLFFEILLFLGLARLSTDINKTRTFRSRVVWEEALRRGIDMKQLIVFGNPVDLYITKIKGRRVYFNSLPIPERMLSMAKNWDDKYILKQEFLKNSIPTPACIQFPIFLSPNLEQIFSKLQKPIIVKPRVGSRGRHTVTNIYTLEQFQKAVDIARQICAHLVVEEHLTGYVCRATFVQGELLGFYRGGAPYVVGDGKKTISELIKEKNDNRPARVESVIVGGEIEDYISRSGFKLDDVLEKDFKLSLTYRTGRFYGGATKEMLDELHPSFVPILTKAAKIVGLPVIGFDCIIPEPTEDASTQRWGIIECNTLPFIDLHYYALEGKPKNIAGRIWDLWG